MVTSSPLKWHGGKAYLATRVRALFPPHAHYVEPYAGSLAVLLAGDGEGVSEVVNDVHKDLLNFWRVLQGGDSFRSFSRLCEATPFSEAEWESADLEFAEWPVPDSNVSCEVTRAWRFFVWCRQSLAGRMESFAPLSRNRTRRGMNEQASAWLSAVEGLPAVHARLKRVAVVGPKDALEVIRQQDGPKTLVAKGRQKTVVRRGGKNACAKLSDSQASEIRGRAAEGAKRLAEEFGVSQTTIRNVVRGRRYSERV